MTRSMHQDAAATAVLRRTMALLLLLLMISLSSFPSFTTACPNECTCVELTVSCKPYTRKLDRIPDRIPPDTLILYLNNKGIRDIEPKLLAHLTELEVLDLDNNKIRDIEPKSFTHLPELQILSLRYNNISELKNGAFSNISNLQKLDLDNNKIRDIEPKSFTHLPSLQTLSLRYNNISELKNGAFANISMLYKLDLSYNKIKHIEPKSLAHLTELKNLSLSYNNISELKNGAFSNISNLQKLYLDNNEIRDIKPKSFTHLTELSFLDLSYNKIRDIEPKSFTHLPELKNLSLKNNNISELKNGAFSNLSNIVELRLDHNPLTCDCNILLFINVLKKSYFERDVFWRSDPSCHFPVDMRKKSLKAITENDFNCTSPDVIVVPENKTVSVGEQLQLSCKAVGNPEPFITWAKDDIDLELGKRIQVLQNNTLIISKVERKDGGQYKCVASNSFGRKSFEAMVNVNGLAENGCNTVFGVIPGFFFIIIILANCLLYNDIL